VSDVETKKIYSYDLKSRKLATVVDSVGFAKGLDYDEIGHNLYWVDSMRKTIEVMSLKTRTRVVLFKEIDRPVDIVVAPNIRYMYLLEFFIDYDLLIISILFILFNLE
jgi:sugar lactone lactonase YvrE